MGEQRTNVEELKGLLERATPRPWHVDQYEPLYVWGDKMEMVAEVRGYGGGLPQEINCKLIVAAVNALPALLAELERLRAETSDWRNAVNAMVKEADSINAWVLATEERTP